MTAWVMARLVRAASNLLVMIWVRLTGLESRKSAVHSVSSIETRAKTVIGSLDCQADLAEDEDKPEESQDGGPIHIRSCQRRSAVPWESLPSSR